MVKIAPSILSADFYNLEKEIISMETCGVEYLHYDVMDGHFVPNISYGPVILASISPRTNLIKDVHLMITDPDKYIPSFAAAGADIITFHAEVSKDYQETIDLIKENGAQPAMVINPDTEAEVLFEVLPYLKMVLVMSVYPGFGGQSFIKDVLFKVKKLAAFREAHGLDFDIEIDGGVNTENAPLIKKAGVDVLVAGSAFFKAADRNAFIASLKSE